MIVMLTVTEEFSGLYAEPLMDTDLFEGHDTKTPRKTN